MDKSYLFSIWVDIVKAKIAISMLLTPLVDPLVLFILSYTESNTFDDDNIFSDDSEVDATKAKSALKIKTQI